MSKYLVLAISISTLASGFCYAADPSYLNNHRVPAAVIDKNAGNSGGNSKDITEELKIMGQSRNLSMGLLMQKDKDKLTFGTPRTNYKDKISDQKSNF